MPGPVSSIISSQDYLNMVSLTQVLAFAVVLAVSVRGQGPASSYLPPGKAGGGGGGGGVGGGGAGGGGGGDEGGQPEPYSFSYEVKDAASGNDYSHKADSDGKVVMGEYMVLLPDTRRQKVKYMADDNGYVADVQYEGEAVYPAGGGAGGGAGGPAGGGAGGGGYPSGGPAGGGAGGANGYPSGRPSGPGLAAPGGSYLPPGK